MSSTVTRNWNLLLRTENNVTRVYYFGYDKNDLFINSYVDLSQSIMYGGYTDTYMLEQFILPALNSVITDINLTIPNTNNYLTGKSNNESYCVGSLQNNSRLTACKLMCITLTQTVTHTDVESVDYTNILTDINTNLSNLNTNIVSKNNQSDIVQVLKDCFIEHVGSRDLSVFKTGSTDDSVKSNAFIPVLLFKIAQLLSSDSNYSYTSSNLIAYRALDNISKKISYNLPTNRNDDNSLFRIIRAFGLLFTVNGFGTNDTATINSSQLKAISDKLANTNDLHTISQAIDLISTAIAQTPTTDTTGLQTELGKISTAVNNIENNPLFELNANVNGIEVCKKNNKNELDF